MVYTNFLLQILRVCTTCMKKPNSYTKYSGGGRTFRGLYSKYPFGIGSEVQKVNWIFPGKKKPDIQDNTIEQLCCC